jgi:hypothetical protein
MEKLKKQIKNYQVYGSKTYMEYEQDKYSKYQNYLYKRALYGLKSLPKEEIEQMCDRKKRRINSVHYRAQGVLNIVKQKITIKYTNEFFKTFFSHSKFAKDIIEYEEVDKNFKNQLNFKDLSLSKDSIVSIFIEEGILPKNFLNLTQKPIGLPNLKNESKT